MAVSGQQRKILLMDMDYYYAQIELRDNPSLKGKPIIISGNPNTRSVVSTCCYNARKFGVASAMSASEAKRKCPNGIFVSPNMKKYQKETEKIKKILHRYSDLVEFSSLDEAYIDVTINKFGIRSAEKIARLIQNEIKLTLGLTCSIGVSFNKELAKIASNRNKPNGIFVITPEDSEVFINGLKIEEFNGVGKKKLKELHSYGIYNAKDYKKFTLDQCEKYFGKFGTNLYNQVHCKSESNISISENKNSLGFERTLKKDLSTKEEIKEVIEEFVYGLELRLKRESIVAKTISLKVKYDDFTQEIKTKTLPYPVNNFASIYKLVIDLLDEITLNNKKVRLLGVSGMNVVKKVEFKVIKFEQIYLELKYGEK